MRFTFILLLSVAALATLSACGDTLPEQALLGAGAGAGTALILDGSVAGGALLGAGANVAYCQSYPHRCK